MLRRERSNVTPFAPPVVETPRVARRLNPRAAIRQPGSLAPIRSGRRPKGNHVVILGANNVIRFMEPPDDQFSVAAVAFLTALDQSGYLMHLVGLTEVFVGLTFLSGRFVPLGLVVYAPVMVNVLAFHLVVDDSPLHGGMSYVMLLMCLFLAWVYMPSFRGVLAARGETRAGG